MGASHALESNSGKKDDDVHLPYNRIGKRMASISEVWEDNRTIVALNDNVNVFDVCIWIEGNHRVASDPLYTVFRIKIVADIGEESKMYVSNAQILLTGRQKKPKWLAI